MKKEQMRGKSRRKKTALLLALMVLTALPISVFSLSASAEGGAAVIPEVSLSVTLRATGKLPSPPEVCAVRLTAVNAAPLPAAEGSASPSDYRELALPGPGTASFPAIAFPTVGVYQYTLSLLPGEIAGAHYDTGVYTVTVTVTDTGEENAPFPTVVLIRDGLKQEAAEFVIDYRFDEVLDGGDPGPGPDTPVDPPEDRPEEPPADEPPDKPEKPRPGKPQPSHPDKLIQTGQHRLAVWLLGGGGAALTVLGAVLTGRGRKKDGEV